MAANAEPHSSGRRESANERNDRNWAELVQEVRVIHPAIRVLTGFLLLAFLQPGFTDIDPVTTTIYLVVVTVAILTTLAGLAPVAIHRTLFRAQAKRTTVDISDRTLRTALVGFALMLIGTATLIFDVAVGHRAGAIAGACTLAVILMLWAVIPCVIRRTQPAEPVTPGQ